MNGAFYVGAAGLEAQQRALDVIANNIANVNTTGFKRAQTRFSELVAPPEADTPVPVTGGGDMFGVRLESTPRVFVEGDLKQTGQPLDLAIDGDGFIELMGPGGETMLWRGGALQVNADGFLAGANGMPLKSMISVPLDAGPLQITPDGKVQAVLAGATTATVIGQIDLVRDKDMASIQALDNGLFRAAEDSDLVTAPPGTDGAGVLAQGALEGSNVQLTDEMVALLVLQRAYAANAQVVQAGDQLMSIANNLRR